LKTRGVVGPGFKTVGVVGHDLKTGGIVGPKIQQTEAHSTGLRVSSSDISM